MFGQKVWPKMAFWPVKDPVIQSSWPLWTIRHGQYLDYTTDNVNDLFTHAEHVKKYQLIIILTWIRWYNPSFFLPSSCLPGCDTNILDVYFTVSLINKQEKSTNKHIIYSLHACVLDVHRSIYWCMYNKYWIVNKLTNGLRHVTLYVLHASWTATSTWYTYGIHVESLQTQLVMKSYIRKISHYLDLPCCNTKYYVIYWLNRLLKSYKNNVQWI